jgi:hypothetical protein
MKGNPIFYRRNYKYQLSRDVEEDLNLWLPFPRLEYDVLNDFVRLTLNGFMLLRFGYCWDGASGPTLDDHTNMRGGLLHDGGYQLMREGLLSMSYRPYFDKILELVCKDDGMPDFRAWYYYEGVHHFAEKCASKGYDPYPEKVAPHGTIERPDAPKGE